MAKTVKEHAENWGRERGITMTKDQRIEQLEAENKKLLDICIAGGFIGQGTQLIGDERYKELIAAEKEYKRISVAYVNGEEAKAKLKKELAQLGAENTQLRGELQDTRISLSAWGERIEQLEARIELALSCIQTGQGHACDLCKSYLDEAEQALGKG